jgi:DNA-binding NarL/FixJ family response regulator
MRELVVHLLERDFEVLGAFEDGQALVDAAAILKPDACVVDISMPVVNGIEAAHQIKGNGSTAKIVFLTIHEDPDFVQAALTTGASGYVIKRCLTSELCTALNEVLAGRTFISSSLQVPQG